MKPTPSVLLPPNAADDDLDRFTSQTAPVFTKPRPARIARPALFTSPLPRSPLWRFFAKRGY